MKRLSRWIVVFASLVLVTGCAAGPVAPLAFNPAPWQPGEVSTYDVIDAAGAPLGTATWRWERTGDGWTQRFESDLRGTNDVAVVVLNAALEPVRARREVAGRSIETTYGPDQVHITTTADGKQTTKTLKPATDVVDNESSLQVQRALPLGGGYRTQYTDLIPATGTQARVRLTVTGVERVTAPAGTFEAWRVVMDFGAGKHDGWYGLNEPYPLVRYRNQASGVSFVLRSLTVNGEPVALPAAGSLVESDTAPAAGEQDLTQPRAAILIAVLGVQLPIMLGLPILLGWCIKRRYGIRWSVWLLGALTFILSQVVHIPVNAALGLIGTPRGVGLWPIAPLALVAGLSAGIAEEGARWVVLRTLARKARGWRAGLQFGAGHGGVESIIFGLLVAVSLIGMVAASTAGPALANLTPEMTAQLRAGQAQFWGAPAYLNLLGALERILAITAHVAMASLVMRSVVRSQPLYLLAAVAWHTLLNAWAVFAAQQWGVLVVEAGLVVFAIASGWIIWRLREPEALAAAGGEAAPPSTAAPTAATLTQRELSDEELARRSNSSRYE